MTLASPLWLTAGVVLGGLHAASLWQAARRVSGTMAATGVMRLLVIATVLVGAALAGGLLPVGMGWGIGLLVSTGLVLRRGKMP